MLDIKQIPSPHHNSIPGRIVTAIVIHTAECREIPLAAENVAQWFKNPTSKVSAHYIVDNDSIVQCVEEGQVAWHAGSVNDWTVGIELAGEAGQGTVGWADPYSMAVLKNAAQLVASLCVKYGIPVERVPPIFIPQRVSGIFGHVDVTSAYGSKGGHYDPGPAFPWEAFLESVTDGVAALWDKAGEASCTS